MKKLFMIVLLMGAIGLAPGCEYYTEKPSEIVTTGEGTRRSEDATPAGAPDTGETVLPSGGGSTSGDTTVTSSAGSTTATTPPAPPPPATAGRDDSVEEEEETEDVVVPPATPAPSLVARAATSVFGSVPFVFTKPKTGMIHLFARCLNSAGQPVLCRMKGPSDLAQWTTTDAGRSKGYSKRRYDDFLIGDMTPVSVLDPVRRKIHVLAGRGTGDLGGAVGVHHFVCDADSMNCRQTGFHFENQLHYQPALVFIAGDRPQNDRIVAFQHGGYGGQLKFYAINPNDDSVKDLGWVGERMATVLAARNRCSQHANIDKTPSVVLTSREDGKKEIHLFARAGHGNPLHLFLPHEEFAKFSSSGGGEGEFRCEQFDYEGKLRFHTGPAVVARPNNRVQIFGGHEAEGVARPHLWTGGLRPAFVEDSPRQIANEVIKVNDFETLTVAADPYNPEAEADIFYRVNHGDPWDRTGGLAHIRVKADGNFASGLTGAEELDFPFLDAPAAVKDGEGNLHVFGAQWGGLVGRFAKIQHIASKVGENTWSTAEDIAASYGVQHHEGHGVSGVTAVYVPNN